VPYDSVPLKSTVLALVFFCVCGSSSSFLPFGSLLGINRNPTNPLQLLFACGDEAIRLYDRRDLSLGTITDKTRALFPSSSHRGTRVFQLFSPSHLVGGHHSTYASFNEDGIFSFSCF
jgi:hypothetical protein